MVALITSRPYRSARVDVRSDAEYYEGMPANPPLCPSCGQPASQALAGPEHGWECRNEACAEFGQAVDEHEPAPTSEPR
jgi:hypothetical protein